MKKIVLGLAAMLALGNVSFAQFTEDFESTTGTALPTGWAQTVATGSPSATVGWNSGTSATLASSSFAVAAHTRFIAVNDDASSTADNSNSFVTSPSFSLGAGTWYLKFDCAFLKGSYGGFTEQATVEASTDGGTTWTVLATLDGNASYWWEPRYINMSSYAGMSNVMLGFRYKDNTGYLFGWGIDNVTVFTPPTNDIQLVSIAPVTGTPNSYGLGGSNITVTGSVFNNGSNAISSYNIKYVFNSGSVVTNAVSGSIAPFTSATFTASTPVTLPSAIGPYQLQVWAELAGDSNPLNDTASLDTLNTVAFLPTKKLAVEEGTGTWCGWCVRGIVYMDSLRELYGDGVSLIAVHNSTSDPMQVATYDAWMTSQISGFPSIVLDRRMTGDPSDLLNLYTAHHNDFGFADVTTTPTLSGSNLSVAVTVKPALTLNGAKLALVITEDEVSGTTAGWEQHNYYSGSSTSFLTGQGLNYNALANPIPATDMSYNFVARSIDPSATGAAGLLPTTMAASTDYSYTFNKTLTSTWVTNNLHGVVLLIDGASGAVLNSQNFTIPLGVSDLTSGVDNFAVMPNPTTSAANVVFDLKKATDVQVSVFDVMGRMVYATPSAHMNAGTNRIAIPADSFAAGMYTVKVQTENGVVSQKLSVTK